MKWVAPIIVMAVLLCGGQARAQSQQGRAAPQEKDDEIRRLKAEIEQAESELKAVTERMRALKQSLAKLEGTKTPSSTSKLLFPWEIERAMLGEANRSMPLPKIDNDSVLPRSRESGPVPPRR